MLWKSGVSGTNRWKNGLPNNFKGEYSHQTGPHGRIDKTTDLKNNILKNEAKFSIQNEISLSAVKVMPNTNIVPISPIKRECYFHYEHDPNHPIMAHRNYSQVKSETPWVLKDLIYMLFLNRSLVYWSAAYRKL